MSASDYGGIGYRDGVEADSPHRHDMAHVILGDGDVSVVLYKQGDVRVYCRRLEIASIAYMNHASGDESVDIAFTIGDWRIDVHQEFTDNHYQYVRLIQPDGVVWTGFSGYGVGFIEDEYGFSTAACVARLRELFMRDTDASA